MVNLEDSVNETDYEMKRQCFKINKQDSKLVGKTTDDKMDDNQPPTSDGSDRVMSQHSVAQEPLQKKKKKEKNDDNITAGARDPLPVASTSFQEPQPQSTVKRKNKLTAKQKERIRVKAQTPEQRKRNAEKNLSATRLRRALAYENETTNVIEETSRLRSSSQLSKGLLLSTDPTESKNIETTIQNADSTLLAGTGTVLPESLSTVKSKHRITEKQREQKRIEEQTPEKRRGNIESKLVATRLRRSQACNQPDNNVILETHRSRTAVPLALSTSSNHGQEIDVDILDYTEWPTSQMLMSCEENPKVALLLFHENAGLYRFHDKQSTITGQNEASNYGEDLQSFPEYLQDLQNQIGIGILSNVKDHCIASFQEQVHYLSSLLACGACGIRSFTTQDGRKMKLDDPLIQLLRLKEEDVAQHDSLGNYKNVCSIFTDTVDNSVRFFLHPELVEPSEQGNFEVYLCSDCLRQLNGGTLPKLSVANGHDYGRIDRLPNLEPLTLVESYLIAQVRLYVTEIKLLAPSAGTVASAGSKCLKGHIISFPHDGPVAAAERLQHPDSFPWTQDVLHLLAVKFVGNNQQFDYYLTRTFSCPELRIRSSVVFKWLKFLKKCNPLYASIIIDDSPAAYARLEELQRDILASATLLGDDATINMEKQLGSDVAGVHWHVSDPVDEEEAETEPDRDAILANVMVTDTGGVSWLPETDSRHAQVFDLINDMVNPSITAATTSKKPINEFIENDRLILGAFPHLFLLGRGVPTTPSSSVDLYIHYIHQYTGYMGKCSQFIFLLSNQRRRHAALRAVATRVKNTPKAFDKFHQMVSSPDFKEKVQRAAQNPLGQEALEVIRGTEPYIQMCGKNVPYSTMERRDAMGSLCAIAQRYGTPSVFLTVSPDDIHHPMILRLAFPSKSNAGFPAHPGSFLEALSQGQAEYNEHAISEFSLQKMVTDNPCASAAVFQMVMNNLFSILLGIPVASKVKKTTPLSQRREGVFGRVTAAFSVTEIQGRGALHAHLAVWGTALTPDLLQKASSHPTLVKQIAEVLDTMYSATIPKEKHLESLLDRMEKIKKPRLIYEQSPLTTLPTEPGTVALPNPSFAERVNGLIDFLQVHSHRKTCLKGPAGGEHCRLSKPSALSESTSPVQLKTNELGEVIACDCIEDFRPLRLTDRDFTVDPLTPLDVRCIFWSLRRCLINVSPESINFEEEDWPAEQLARFGLLSISQQQQVVKALRKRNGSIVEVNDVITALVASNTAAYFLGGAEQAKSIMFYLIKYMTKDSVSLTNSITVINDAMVHNEKYPSVADDSGTPHRTTQYFLQRVINYLAGKIELSAPQAAAHLLDMPSSLSSTRHCFCFILAAIQQVATRLELTDVDLSDNDNDDGADSDQEDSDDNQDEQDESLEHVEPASSFHDQAEETTLLKNFLSSSIEPRYGSAPIYIIDGVPVPIAQDTHYAYRGLFLQSLSYYEYTGIVSVVKRPVATKSSTHPSTGAGRQVNATFDFDSRHPLQATHHQKLRSLQMTPILAGGPPPRYPGSKPANPSRSWTKAAQRYAMYIMTAFCPWRMDTLVPEGGTSWNDLGRFMRKLNGDGGVRPPTFLELCREKLITSVSRSLVINNKNKKMMVKWRNRAATAWNGEPDWSGDFQQHLNAEQRLDERTRNAEDQAARDIDDLRAATNADDDTVQAQVLKDRAMKDYIDQTLNTLHGVFGSVAAEPRDELQLNYVLTHVHFRQPTMPTEEQVRDALKEKEPVNIVEPGEQDPTTDLPTVSGMPSPQIELNRVQQQLVDRMAVYLQAKDSGLDPHPELLLLYGGPGVGKTHTIFALQQRAEALGNGVVVCTPTGAAATNIPGAKTIHSTFGFRVQPNDITMDEQLPPMPALKLADAKLGFKNKSIFLIDEVSMLGPIGLAHINQRLQEITGCQDRPFGGLAVLLSGDPYQLQPVASKSLYSSVVDQPDLLNRKSHKISPATIGANLFSQFVLFELTEQMRTADLTHIALIDRLRNPAITNPINFAVIQSLVDKQLTAADAHRDPDWSCAPIVVTLNEVRATINYNMACRFAKRHNLPVIKWRLPISGPRATALNKDETDQLYQQEEHLWGVFVAGAPGYLTYNINPSKGLANGTAIVYDSLSFKEDVDFEQVRMARMQIACAEPGDIIILDLVPHTINVHLPSVQLHQWPANQTLSADRVVIPIFTKNNTDLLRVRACGRFKLPGNVTVRSHAVELGFSITYEKVQGKTMNKIVLNLNASPTRPLQFPAVYTGITRVRKGCDLKILPVSAGRTLQHLTKLKLDPKLVCWLHGFDPLTGRWDRERAKQQAPERRATGKKTPTKKTTPKK